MGLGAVGLADRRLVDMEYFLRESRCDAAGMAKGEDSFAVAEYMDGVVGNTDPPVASSLDGCAGPARVAGFYWARQGFCDDFDRPVFNAIVFDESRYFDGGVLAGAYADQCATTH